MDNKNNTSLYEHTEEFPFPAMEPDKDEMFINIRNRNPTNHSKQAKLSPFLSCLGSSVGMIANS